MRTLTGYDVNMLTTILDQPLPRSAYKKIPAGSLNLTDIDAGWQRRAFNKIFGLYGIGWGFDFTSADINIRHEEVKRSAGEKMEAFAKVFGQFWYAYVDDKGLTKHAQYPVTGANNATSGNEAYAMKGAITNAIGFGASMIGWQESVYLGARSHDNVEGFAEGKDWCDVEPETVSVTEVAPPVSITPKNWHAEMAKPKPDPEPPAPTLTPSNWQAGIAKQIENEKPEPPKNPAPPARPAAEPTPPTATETQPDPEPEKPAPVAEKSLAENLGFGSMRHLVCVHCGYCEPVNVTPPVCRGCGVDGDVWSDAGSHVQMRVMSKNIKERVSLKTAAASSKEVLDALKLKHNGDRRLLLLALSNVTGRQIKNYADCNTAEMQAALAGSSSAPETAADKPVTPAAPAKPLSKVGLSKEIFAIAATLGLGTPRQVIAEIGKVANKSITSSLQLNETELSAVLENFKGRIGK